MICNEMAFFSANFILQTSHDQEDHHSSTSINPILQSCAPQDFHGVAPLLGKRSAVSFSGLHDIGDDTNLNGDDELSDDGSQIGEKKRRLNMEQVKTLEKNFELGNKLEPERKMQLARALGLQPRQIAIWFQNRRARWKTKQLEKDYDLLKRQYEIVKADNDALQAQNKKLHAEISALKNRVEAPAELLINLNKETEGSCSNRSENSSDINLDLSRTPPAATDSPLSSNPIRPLFPSSVIRPASTNNNTVAAQFFQTTTTTTSSIKSEFQRQAQKMDSTTNNCVQDENFCNMFCGIDDQQGFWAWPEQQQFH